MKTSHDPRHKSRQSIIQHLFAESFTQQPSRNKKIQEILSHLGEIDAIVSKVAPEFPVEKINRVELAILRLAIFELKIEKETPPKVIVDEAIELAKEFGGDSSPSFINGALGAFLKDIDKKQLTLDDRN